MPKNANLIFWVLERPWVLWLLLLPVAAAYTQTEYWNDDADQWETTAAVRVVAENPLAPRNPMLALPGDTSPRLTPFTVSWGVLMRWLDLDILTVMKLICYMNGLLFVTGITRFARSFSKNPIFPNVLLLTMLLIWGTSYAYASSYVWWWLMYSLGHSATFAYGIAFHSLAFLGNYSTSRRRSDLIGYALLSWLVFISHPITGLWLYIAAFALAIELGGFRQAILLQAIPLLAPPISMLWPYFDNWKLLTGGTSTNWYILQLHDNQFLAMGPLLFVLAYFVYYIRKGIHPFPWIGWAICIAIYFVSWVGNLMMGERFIVFSAFFLQFALAFELSQWITQWRNSPAALGKRERIIGFSLAAIVLIGLSFRELDVRMSGSLMYSYLVNQDHITTETESYGNLQDYLNSTSVVLTDSCTGFVLPALTGASLVYQKHGNPFLSEALAERRYATAEVMQGTSSPVERDNILSEYRVTHILFDRKRPELFLERVIDDLQSRYPAVINSDSLVLFEIPRTHS